MRKFIPHFSRTFSFSFFFVWASEVCSLSSCARREREKKRKREKYLITTLSMMIDRAVMVPLHLILCCVFVLSLCVCLFCDFVSVFVYLSGEARMRERAGVLRRENYSFSLTHKTTLASRLSDILLRFL